jgi:hypothetical protein
MARPKVDLVERVFSLYTELTAPQQAQFESLKRVYLKWRDGTMSAKPTRSRKEKPTEVKVDG